MHTFDVHIKNGYIDIKNSIEHSLYLFKDKSNRPSKGSLNLHHLSSNSSGSLPKRYQSVYAEGTPLASFGVRQDDNTLRSRSVEKIFLFCIFFCLFVFLATYSYAITTT